MLLDRRPQDRQLSRRLAATARAAARAQLRAEIAHVKAVQRRERGIVRARRQLPRQLLLSVAAGVATVPLDGGSALLATVTAGVAGFSAYGSVRALRRPPVPPLGGAVVGGPGRLRVPPANNVKPRSGLPPADALSQSLSDAAGRPA